MRPAVHRSVSDQMAAGLTVAAMWTDDMTAIGTVAAAVVAAGLGVSATMADRRRVRRGQWLAANQVILTFQADTSVELKAGRRVLAPAFEVFNASDRAITDVVVHARPSADFIWSWTVEPRQDLAAPEIVAMKAPYLATQTAEVFPGHAVAVMAGGSLTPATDRTTYIPDLQVSWNDIEGQRWHRWIKGGQLEPAQRDRRQPATRESRSP